MSKFKPTKKEKQLIQKLDAKGIGMDMDLMEVAKNLSGEDQKTFVGLVQRKLQQSDSLVDNFNEFVDGFRLGMVTNEDRERFKMKHGLDPMKMLDQDINAGNFVAKGAKFTGEMIADFFTGGVGGKLAAKGLAKGAGTSILGESAGAAAGGFGGKALSNTISNLASKAEGVAPDDVGLFDLDRTMDGTIAAGVAGGVGAPIGRAVSGGFKAVAANASKGGASKALFGEVTETVTKIKNKSEKILTDALGTIQDKYAKQKVAAQNLYRKAAKKAERVKIDLTQDTAFLEDIAKLSEDAQKKMFKSLGVNTMEELKQVSARNINEFVKVLDQGVEGLFERNDSSKILDFEIRERFNRMLPDEVFGKAKEAWKGFLDTFGRFDQDQTKQLAKLSKVRTKTTKGVGEAVKSSGVSTKDAVNFFSKEGTKPESFASALDLLGPEQAKEVLEASVFTNIKPTKKKVFEAVSQLPKIEESKALIDELASNNKVRSKALENSGAALKAAGANEGGLFTESSFKAALDSLDQAGGRLSKVSKGSISELSDKLKDLSFKSANAESLAGSSLKKELNPELPTNFLDSIKDSVSDNRLLGEVAGRIGAGVDTKFGNFGPESIIRTGIQSARAGAQTPEEMFQPFTARPDTPFLIDDAIMFPAEAGNVINNKAVKPISNFIQKLKRSMGGQ